MIGPYAPKKLKVKVSAPERPRPLYLPDKYLPILAFDPGGTTGWSLIVLQPNAFDESLDFEGIISGQIMNWWHGQIDCHDENLGCHQLKSIIDRWPSAVIVFEGFSVRQLAVDLSPVSITARIEDHLWNHHAGKEIFKQTAAQAKTTATNDRLKAWGVYTADGGLNHARDADRHALLFIRRCMQGKNSQELRERAWLCQT